jgi:DNA invertase Pin-like site-specific DNA recombinase
VLVVTRLDRPARSTRDLLNILPCLANAPMLAGIAEFERKLIRTRTGEGRKACAGAAAICGRDADGYWAVLRSEPRDHRPAPYALSKARSSPPCKAIRRGELTGFKC